MCLPEGSVIEKSMAFREYKKMCKSSLSGSVFAVPPMMMKCAKIYLNWQKGRYRLN